MLHLVRKKNNDDIDGGTSLWNEPVVTREGNGTNIAIGTGEPGRCSATESGKKNVRLGIVPVVVKGQSQHSGIARTYLGSDVSLCDLSLTETWCGWEPKGIHPCNC